LFWQKWWFWVVILGFALPVFGDQLKAIVAAWRGESKKIRELREEIVDLRQKLAEAEATNKAYEIQEELQRREDQTRVKSSTGQEVAVLGFCDLVGFTDFLTGVGDEIAKDVLDQYNKMVRGALDKFDGREIKQLGDGFLFSFGSSQKALRASMAIRNGVDDINSGNDTNLSVKIGLHAGEIIRDNDDVIGSAVNMTERIMQQASGGQVVVSETVRKLTGPGSNFEFFDLGARSLKGFSEPKNVYRVEFLEKPDS
jgi:class 3 adenylate cyclase